MPTENELKFVIKFDKKFEKAIHEAAYGYRNLEQGYMHRKSKLTVRVRKQQDEKGNCDYFLQTKLKTKKSVNYDLVQNKSELVANWPSRVIEISQTLSNRDFLDFWNNAKGKLAKRRYLIKSGTSAEYFDDGTILDPNIKVKPQNKKRWQEIWEIDFFKDSRSRNYFAVAECEIPELLSEPLFEIPKLILDNTVFRVPMGDSRFSNSRLGNIKYATRLFGSLM